MYTVYYYIDSVQWTHMIYIDIVRLECADSEDMYIGTVAEPHRFTPP